jgi:cob(I)alamin adenosyltransferase
MSLTTKTGDDGTSDLIGGRRVAKDHPTMECLGIIDELNAFLGDAKLAVKTDTAEIILSIQKNLFDVSSLLASGTGKAPGEEGLSALIDELEANQQPLTTFAVPGANAASAKLHIARAVCRRAERALVRLGSSVTTIPAGEHGLLLAWFNRLSDLLFLLAEEAAHIN